MRSVVLALLLTAALGVYPLTRRAEATVLRGLSLERLCARSTQIVRGQVIATSALWQAGRIRTAVTFRVDESLHGGSSVGSQLTVWHLGGRVGRVVQFVRGAPRFGPGDKLLLFLHPRRGRLFVTGMVQGRFAIRPATATAPAQIQATAHRVPLLGSARVLSQPLAYRDFARKIRHTLGRLKRQRRTP